VVPPTESVGSSTARHHHCLEGVPVALPPHAPSAPTRHSLSTMCGIIAVLLANKHEHCNQSLYDGLTVLQHRGQGAFPHGPRWRLER
jgi:hypothetical protein